MGDTKPSDEGNVVYLTNENKEVLDSCVVAHAKFSFTGTMSGQDVYTIKLGNLKATLLMQEGANVIVDLTSEPANVTDQGGLNDLGNTIDKRLMELTTVINNKAQKMLGEGKPYNEVRDSLASEIEGVYDIYRNSITENKDNILGAFILGQVAGELYNNLEQLDSICAQVKYATKISTIVDFRKELEAAENTKEGSRFVDFTGLSTDNTPVSLSSFVGKGQYVLVDFWASWCGPCRREIPNLKTLQEKLGEKNFTVLGVNVWDEEGNFKAALENEGITYPQIFVPRNNADNATQLYGITGIPQIMLFSPDGTILKRNLRGEEMIEYVTQTIEEQ